MKVNFKKEYDSLESIECMAMSPDEKIVYIAGISKYHQVSSKILVISTSTLHLLGWNVCFGVNLFTNSEDSVDTLHKSITSFLERQSVKSNEYLFVAGSPRKLQIYLIKSETTTNFQIGRFAY